MNGKMRVSVVATGIDAVVSNAETPLPRRSMAQPQQAPRKTPEVTSIREETDVDPDQERIEIPAFLRRQAN